MKNLTRLTPFSLSSYLLRTLTTSSSSITNFSLKNVTKSNFDETLLNLTTHVKDADFVAIDLEMTGVTSSPWREAFEFDRSDIQYLKVKDSAEKFAVLQFGVCPFRFDSLRNSFVAHPHNFYIFPRQELSADGPAYEFLCQTSSIDFLAKYQFDFNVCIREGVSYLSRSQEDEALSRLNSIYNGKWQSTGEIKDVPLGNVADILFSERMKNHLSEWHDMLLLNRKAVLPTLPSAIESKQQFETIFLRMRPALRLNGFTSHQLKLIELVTRKHFKDLVFICAYDESSIFQKLVVYVESENDKIRLMEEVKNESQQQARKNLKAAAGFRHVIDLLSAEQKLIVGHNCFLDVAHMYHKFIGSLPPSVEEYVSSIHKSFPHIVDTKVMLNVDPSLQLLVNNASTSLASAFSLLCPEIAFVDLPHVGIHPCVKVEVQVDDMRSSNWNSGARHEAGYDAFMTGCVFAQACSHLAVDFSSEKVTDCENLQKYVNLLYLSWNSGDVINLSTGSINETLVSFAKKRLRKILHHNTILIWGFPSKLKVGDIKLCICKVLGMHSVACIYKLDETAVFVQFSTADLAASFLALKKRLETCDESISVLHPLSKLLEGGNTCAAGYEIYKDICSSSISKVLFAEQVEAIGIDWKTKLMDESEVVEQSLDPEQLIVKSARSSLSAMDLLKSRKIKNDVQHSTPNQSLFEKFINSIV
ncbi:poly(A)-specific ribonuclease PARN isoform X1 [Amaranthus tricolor]|uniref:poly(A)-specific ribonuclease PARN isoform X1 n=1 Tax=Amaranthus tricolor TaxID=29722 RepID=UPI0025846C4F|nr:poly(A)-specific ribonuclease PARN isoform X1 [Amaranthus tricolor]